MSLEEALRREGNAFFAEGEWLKAIEKYGACVEALLGKGESTVSTDKVNLLLAHSNRAQAWLQLGQHESALEDAEKALKLDERHVKSLLRKATALHGMQYFEDAAQAYRMLLRAGARGVEEKLKQAVIEDQQTRLGVYELSDWWASDGPGHAPVPELEEYVGPVEIRTVGGNMGRGLFASQDVEAGQLLFATAPLASTPLGSAEVEEMMEIVAGLEAAIHKAQTNLETFPELQRLVQIDTLLSDSLETPAMRFYKPLNSLNAQDRILSSTDRNHPALKHRFSPTVLYDISCSRSVIGSEQVGIYALGYLMNHSCLPNAHFLYVQVGSMKFARATRNVRAGDQLLTSYFTVLCPLKERRDFMQHFAFCCTCARCVVEEQVLMQIPDLKALEEECTKMWKCRPELDIMSREKRLKMRASCITIIEQVEWILNNDPHCAELREEEKDWMRASFVRLHRLLLDPNLVMLVLIPDAPLELREKEQGLIYRAVAAMTTVDPASPTAFSLLGQHHLVGLPSTDFVTLKKIRDLSHMLYGIGLKEEAYFRQFQAGTGISLLSTD